MANNNRNYNNGGSNVAVKIVAMILVVVLGIAYVAVAIWKQSWNPVKWISTEQVQPGDNNNGNNNNNNGNNNGNNNNNGGDNNENTDDGGNSENEGTSNLVISESGNNNGISLVSAVLPASAYAANGISENAESAYLISATITPDNTDNKQVDFTVAWATSCDKNILDYLVVSQTSDGSTTATISCLQPFDTQAVLTVTSRSSSSAKATATLDYRKKIASITDNIFDGDTTSIKVWNVSSNPIIKVPATINWTKGTIFDSLKENSINITIAASEALKTALINASLVTSIDREVTYTDYLKWGLYTNGMFTFGGPYNSTGLEGEKGLFYFAGNLYDYGEEEIDTAKYNKLRDVLSNCNIDLIITVNAETESGYTYTASYNVNILDSSLEVLATDVELSSSVIIF
ncbi:MAG: hypothetical protein ACI4L9_01930 [Candidatus Coproplasma sp.]